MVALVCPIWVTNQPLLDLVYRVAATWDGGPGWHVYAVSNRLHHVEPDEFARQLAARCPAPVTFLHEPGVSRSVAGAWNYGIETARTAGYREFIIAAQDAEWRPGSLARLAAAGRAGPWWLVSGTHEPSARGNEVTEGCDFTGVYLPLATYERVGPFDEEFRPAYFEDNDYVARVWQAGGDTRQAHAATFFHHGSATCTLCPDARHHATHWFDHNRRLFRTKWGADPVGTLAEARLRYRL